MKSLALILVLSVLLPCYAGEKVPKADEGVIADAAIKQILADRIDTHKQAVNLVVGVIEPAGTRVVSYGKPPADGDTIFEIGSITKVFTALLLADMVERGEVALTDPVAKYLPETVKVPERGGKKITLEHLATHTSALPRLPANLFPRDASNPYADYTVGQLYDFLSSTQLMRDIGSKYEYSNLGAGLLGHVLARRAGMDYETLVRKRILEPLGMKSTSITLSKEMKARLAVGHGDDLKPATNWDLPTLAGAGALRSTVNDMLKLAGAALGYTKTPLAKPMAAMLASRRATEMPNLEIALGWHIGTAGGRDIVWHNGGTGGYRSYLGLDPKTRTGVVVLSNTATTAGVNDIGLHLLNPESPLMKPPRSEVKVEPAILETYAGVYELAPGISITVTRDGAQLFAQVTGQGKVEIYPESPRGFFYKVVDAQITFNPDDKSLVLHQNGVDTPAKRIGDAPLPAKVEKEITVDPKLLDRYTGRYQLAPEFFVTVTREDNRLFAQATAQPKFEIYAKSEREFFFKVVEATVTFNEDGSLTLRQSGMEIQGKRIE